jgi:hypothetical protein
MAKAPAPAVSHGPDPDAHPIWCDPDRAFVTPRLVKLASLWEAKRRQSGRDIPGRDDFELRELSFAAENVAIVEIVPGEAGTRYRIRFMGSALDGYFGALTGRFVDEALPPFIAVRWERVFASTVSARALQRWFGRVAMEGRTFFLFETLCAPLAGRSSAVESLLISTHQHSRFNLVTCESEHYARLEREFEARRRGA